MRRRKEAQEESRSIKVGSMRLKEGGSRRLKDAQGGCRRLKKHKELTEAQCC